MRAVHVVRVIALLAAAIPLAAGRAQDAPASPVGSPRTVDGRIVRPGATPADAPRPVAGVQVVLHRIGSDTAGPLDSLRTGRDGRYAFRYRPTGSPEALYIVSAEYQGIAYFAPALRDEAVSGDDAEIIVFDTTSMPVALAVRARHIVVSSPLEGDRQVLEIYELANDGTLTLVPGAQERAVWTAIVPPAAHDFTVPGDQGIAPSAVQHADGRVLLFAPFTPGIRQLAFSYRVPADSFPLRMPVERPTATLEVMLEEETATASAPGLAETDPVSVEGRTFRRFVGTDLPASALLTIAAPSSEASSRGTVIFVTVAAIAVVMLVVLVRAFTRRGDAADPGESGRG